MWRGPTSEDPVLGLVENQVQHRLDSLKYWIVALPTYALVRYEGRVATVEVASAWTTHIDSFLREHRLSQVLWDSRPAEGHPSDVRKQIWAWLERAEVVKRSAIVVESEMLRLSANLSSVGGKLDIHAFDVFEEADRWLGR